MPGVELGGMWNCGCCLDVTDVPLIWSGLFCTVCVIPLLHSIYGMRLNQRLYCIYSGVLIFTVNVCGCACFENRVC